MKRLSGLSLVMVLLLNGCTGTTAADDADNGDAPPAPVPASTPPGVAQGNAAVAERALEASDLHLLREPLLRGERIDFHMTMWFQGRLAHDFAGTYRWKPEGWALTGDVRDPTEPGQPLPMLVTSLGDELWMKMPDWKMGDCWLPVAQGAAPVGMLAMMGAQPRYVTLLQGLRRAATFDPATGLITGRLSLNEAILLLTGRAVQQMNAGGRDYKTRTIPVVVEVIDDRIASITIRGTDIVAGVTAAGVKVPKMMVEFMRSIELTVGYPTAVRPHKIRRPKEVCAQN